MLRPRHQQRIRRVRVEERLVTARLAADGVACCPRGRLLVGEAWSVAGVADGPATASFNVGGLVVVPRVLGFRVFVLVFVVGRVFGFHGSERKARGATRLPRAALVKSLPLSPDVLLEQHDAEVAQRLMFEARLLPLGGMPWARIGELAGHGDLVTTARTYTHVVADEAELDYAAVLR
jgi:hypothetical protein